MAYQNDLRLVVTTQNNYIFLRHLKTTKKGPKNYITLDRIETETTQTDMHTYRAPNIERHKI